MLIHEELLNLSSGVQDQLQISTAYLENVSEMLLVLKTLNFQLNITVTSTTKAQVISVSLSAQNYATIKRETLMLKDVAEKMNSLSNTLSVATEMFSNKVLSICN